MTLLYHTTYMTEKTFEKNEVETRINTGFADLRKDCGKKENYPQLR